MAIGKWIAAPILLASAAVQGQALPNPGGMAPDTPRMETGNPPPEHQNTQDKLFLRQATAGGMAEVELGKLARQKGSDAGVKAFGQKMESDHGKGNQLLQGIARPPSAPQLDAEQRRMHERLNGLGGREFDQAYLASQVAMHQQTANLLLWELSYGQSGPLTRYAAEQLPLVIAHLEEAKQLQAAATGATGRH